MHNMDILAAVTGPVQALGRAQTLAQGSGQTDWYWHMHDGWGT